MKFTVVGGDFKTAFGKFEDGNRHDSENLGIPDDAVKRWHGAGFVAIDGYPDPPARKPGSVRINPKNVQMKAGGKK